VTLSDGVTVRVAESGDASAPTVLLVHGWGASMYMWRDWFAPLAAAGRRVVAVDLPGHGLSDKPTDPGRYTQISGVSGPVGAYCGSGVTASVVVARY